MTTTSTIKWTEQEVIYHIYPLGMLGAEQKNTFSDHIINRLPELMNWVQYYKDLGISCIYLGPVFSSESHGYDTEDYCKVDQRLGTNADLKALVEYFHQHNIKIVLDGVFNHTGRSFFAFRDVLEKGDKSAYCNWIKGLDFNANSPYNDGFTYETWNGHYNLVKLNQDNENVRDYFKSVIDFWIDNFNIDGIRFDAADVMNRSFLAELTRYGRSKKSEFWTVGEVIHGDYRLWTNEAHLDSVTNYEAYKSLYSSLNDKNYYELAWTLNRQFGDGGMYNDLSLYNFCDNHDVHRISSILNNSSYIFPLYLALFTIPGIPVIMPPALPVVMTVRNFHLIKKR